ncbi:MAG: FAD binding domain-containing protein [Candidatus Muiribacteriota bacterium]
MLNEKLKYARAESIKDIFKYAQMNYMPFAGGTDIMIKAKEGFLKTEGVVYIGEVKELKGIYEDDDSIFIGAAETIEDISSNNSVKKYFPAFVYALQTLGSLQIRNLATIGGNLGNCSPVADSVPMLMALEAKVHIISGNLKKIIDIKDFPKGVCKNVLQSAEIIEKIEIPKINSKNIQFYRKFGQRQEVTIQKCSLGALIFIEKNIIKDARLAIGAVSVRALRCFEAEDFIKGKIISENNIKKCADLIKKASKPISDIRSTVNYRREVVGNAFIEGMYEYL